MNTFINLTIETQKSIFNGIKLNETINIRTLELLIGSDLLKVIDKNNNKVFINEELKLEDCYENEKLQLMAYKKLYNYETENIEIVYKMNKKYGRVYSNKNLSFIGLRKEIRYALAEDNYVDIDISNAHNAILKQICEYKGLKCDNLKKYVENREECLNEIIIEYETNRETAKQLFIMLLYYGSFDRWKQVNNICNKEQNKYLKDFQIELKKIGDNIVLNNPKMVKALITEKNKNINGSIVSYFLQDYERRILEIVYEYLTDNNYIINNNASLCHDGIMILKENYNDKILIKLNKHILNYTGMDLKFEKKEMINNYKEALEKLEKTSGELIKHLDNDISLNLFLKLNCPNFYKFSKGEYYIYNDETKLYEERDTEDSEIYISKNITTFMEKNKNLFENNKTYNILYKRYTNNINQIILKLQNNHDLKEQLNKKIGIIPIKNNKILNLDTLEVRERVKDDNFTFEMPVNYKPNDYNETEIKKYFEDLFKNDNELIQIVLNLCKSIIYGIRLRYIFVFQGDGNNGKSLFINLLKHIYNKFGSSVDKKVMISTDIGSNLTTELEILENIRVGFLSETKDEDKFNDELIKRLTGGDDISVRSLFKSHRVMKTNVSLLLCTNHFPTFDKTEKSMLERIMPIPFLNSFEINEEFKNKIESMYDDIFTYIIKHGIITTKFKKCKIMQECLDEQKSEFDTFSLYFNEKYTITLSKNDFISSSNIKINYNIWCIDNGLINNIKSESQYGKALKICDVNWKSEVKDKKRGYRFIKNN
jgi:P4 family phage/plasmid primase-like protien